MSRVTSLKHYIETLDSLSAIYFKTPDAYNYEFLKHVSEDQLSDIAMGSAAYACGAIPQKSELNRDFFTSIRKIFSEGKNVYLMYNSSIGEVIDTLTRDAQDSNIWRKNMNVVIHEGVIYPGIKSQINGKISVRLMNETGEETNKYKKDLPVGRVKERRFKFANLRDELGFKRLLLQRGAVLPVDLLRRTANKCKDTQCPPLALAWLFKETIELMESYPEPLANGIALSPSLRKDIREFKGLERQIDLKKGCWLLPHKEKHERALTAFFARVAEQNYQREIDRRLKYILDAHLVFAGFMGERDHLVVLSNMISRPLYLISWDDEKKVFLTPYSEYMRLQRFTPVFSIEPMDPFPQMQGKTTQTQKVSKQVEPIPSLFPDEETGAADDGVSHGLSGKQLKIHEVLDSVHIDRAYFDKTFISDVVELLRGGS